MDVLRWGHVSPISPKRPFLSRYSTSDSPRILTALTGLSSSSTAAPIGCQYRRSNSPIGVPGPTFVNRSFSLTVSMAPPFAYNVASRALLSSCLTHPLSAQTGHTVSPLQHGLLGDYCIISCGLTLPYDFSSVNGVPYLS